jgi:hypothetical protein
MMMFFIEEFPITSVIKNKGALQHVPSYIPSFPCYNYMDLPQLSTTKAFPNSREPSAWVNWGWIEFLKTWIPPPIDGNSEN